MDLPAPLQRYLHEVDRRRQRVEYLRGLLRHVQLDLAQADYALSEAHRDLRDVRTKWLAAQTVARRLLAMGVQSPQEKARADEIYRVLTAAAQEVGVSPNYVLLSVSPRR